MERLRVLIGEGKGGEGTIYGGARRRSQPRCQAPTPEQSLALIHIPPGMPASTIPHVRFHSPQDFLVGQRHDCLRNHDAFPNSVLLSYHAHAHCHPSQQKRIAHQQA